MIEASADTEALKARLEQIRANTRDLKKPLLRAGLVVLKAAQDRIDAGGPGWAPNKSGTPLLHRTGRLLSSLTVNNTSGGNDDTIQNATETSITVGTNVQYAAFLQNGTGVLGSMPAPKRKGKTVSGGIPPRRFLFIGPSQADRIKQILGQSILAKTGDDSGDAA